MKKSHVKKMERMRLVLSKMRETLDDMSGEYRDKFDNASENWQSSDAGTECDTAREELEQAAADVESAESTLANLCS